MLLRIFTVSQKYFQTFYDDNDGHVYIEMVSHISLWEPSGTHAKERRRINIVNVQLFLFKLDILMLFLLYFGLIVASHETKVRCTINSGSGQKMSFLRFSNLLFFGLLPEQYFFFWQNHPFCFCLLCK